MSLVLPLLTLLSAQAGKADSKKAITKIEGTDVMALLQELGHDPKLQVDEVGDPLITANNAGTKYLVLFYDCKDHRQCQAIQFRAFYELERPTPLERINDFNRDKLLGRAYLDVGGDPTIELTVRLRGGVTRDHLRAERDWFLRALSDFNQLMYEVQTAPTIQTL